MWHIGFLVVEVVLIDGKLESGDVLQDPVKLDFQAMLRSRVQRLQFLLGVSGFGHSSIVWDFHCARCCREVEQANRKLKLSWCARRRDFVLWVRR